MENVLIMKNLSTVRQYTDTNFHLTFFNYLLVALPASFLMLILSWIWLQIRYGLIEWPICKNRSSNEVNEHLRRTLKRQYNELGYLRQIYSFLNKEKIIRIDFYF
jgi:di/tricarboxylate transporter